MTTFKVDKKQYQIVEPNDQDLAQAEKIKRDALCEALNKPGAFIAHQCMDKAKQMGIWSDEKEEELEQIQKRMYDLSTKLNKGGYSAKQAEEDAKELGNLRLKVFNISKPVDELASYSVDAYADEVYSDYLLYCKICDDKGEKVFSSFHKYVYEKNCNNDIILGALDKLYEDTTKKLNDAIKELPENKAFIALGILDADLKETKAPKEETEKVEFKPFTKK